MIGLPAGTRIWLACGVTDMRKGFDGLGAILQLQLAEDALSGHVFVFRGRRGDRVKLLWWDGDGLCVLQTPGAWPICLAPGGEWRGAFDASAVVDAPGRDRLVSAAAYAA